ncbi:hypothetical protein JGUZn3_04490 [Entomobacter blattae]|uniref:Uncharacterized protein n=1 Tax=Entomobacter blattae TaxID=2762277 RepID=A0A7H1NPI8_9PROT|nr:hypothetical protein JGUZn3_04490 [Entomobacter blattae]
MITILSREWLRFFKHLGQSRSLSVHDLFSRSAGLVLGHRGRETRKTLVIRVKKSERLLKWAFNKKTGNETEFIEGMLQNPFSGGYNDNSGKTL